MLTLMKPYDPDLGTKLGLFVHFSETSRANKDQNTQTGELVWARERARVQGRASPTAATSKHSTKDAFGVQIRLALYESHFQNYWLHTPLPMAWLAAWLLVRHRERINRE